MDLTIEKDSKEYGLEDLREKEFQLELWQDDFIYCPDRFPAMVSAWGTGKTLCLILRSLIYAKLIPNNLGLICRKEYNDLADSTIRDFQDYTGLKVNSKRNVDFPNGSRIMFRHLEEIMGNSRKGQQNLQNINLGFAAIEQAEELMTDRAFWLLWGRLRRKVKPTKQFIELNLPLTSAWLIANVAGDNWVKKLWKGKPEEQFKLVEAKTHENAHNLPVEFLQNLETMKRHKPEMYRRYVLNDWDAEVDTMVFSGFDRLMTGSFQAADPECDYIGGLDLAKSKDFTVVFIINARTKNVDYIARWNRDSVNVSDRTFWQYSKTKIKAIDARFGNVLWFTDATGVGDPIVEDLQRDGLAIFCEKEKVHSGIKFTNQNKEQMVERGIIAIQEEMITLPDPAQCENEEQKELLEVFYNELRIFRCELLPSRKVRYAAPEGEHDDTVWAFLLAIWGLMGELYEKHEDPEPVTEDDIFWQRVKRDQSRIQQEKEDEDSEHHVIEDGAKYLEG